MNNNNGKVRYRIERHPPEGGWGYVVTFGLGISLGCCWGSYSCFSLMFNDFIKSVGGETSAFTVVMGFVNVALSISALFTGTLSKKISIRSTALLGATLICLSNLVSIFATSVVHLIISYGIFLGAGMGFMLPACFAIFNGYFVKKRILMMSIAQSFNAAMIMAYPLMVQFLMNRYSYKGALAIIAAINGHAILGMLTMQPVEWHQKVIKVRDEEAEPFINPNSNENGIKLTVVRSNGDEGDTNDKIELSDMEVKKPLEVISEVPYENKLNGDNKASDDSKSMKSVNHNNLASTERLDDYDARHRRLSIASVMSLGNSPIMMTSNKTGFWQKVVDFLDLTHLKDMVYVNIVLGLTFAHFADGYFFMIEPVYLFDVLKISKDDTALIMAVTALFDLISRIVMSIICLFVTLKARHIYTFGAVACILSRFVFLEFFEFKELLVVSAVMGFLKTLIFLPTPLVLAEYLSKRRFTSGYGLYLFIQGVLSFLLSPFIGWVRDTTQSYVICFHTLTFILALCAVPWIIELVWFRIYPRKFVTSAENLNENVK